MDTIPPCFAVFISAQAPKPIVVGLISIFFRGFTENSCTYVDANVSTCWIQFPRVAAFRANNFVNTLQFQHLICEKQILFTLFANYLLS